MPIIKLFRKSKRKKKLLHRSKEKNEGNGDGKKTSKASELAYQFCVNDMIQTHHTENINFISNDTQSECEVEGDTKILGHINSLFEQIWKSAAFWNYTSEYWMGFADDVESARNTSLKSF